MTGPRSGILSSPTMMGFQISLTRVPTITLAKA